MAKTITLKEYSKISGLKESTIRKRIMDGIDLPGVIKRSKIGQYHLFLVDKRKARKAPLLKNKKKMA